jgi:hypothetical protein
VCEHVEKVRRSDRKENVADRKKDVTALNVGIESF